ncbi:YeiH family protein [Algihabitans albus]|uniref:YeiH family protein n=1 Tax=Algihabitans albus TaxID=2164067 RepID=UPI000E5CFF07|nr:putative sulfate exporter family transporter [Algihabitans albus]
MTDQSSDRPSARQRFVAPLVGLAPGFLVCATVAFAAQFLSDHYGAPAMLMALLLGIAFHFLAEEGPSAAGVAFTSRSVLRFGVALLGARISAELVMDLGADTIALIVSAVAATILFGLLAARLLGRGWRLALLTGGSVAICGASAAMAIAAVLPRNHLSERNLIFTIIGVTALSTVAMIVYPLLTAAFAMDDRAAGIFIGATIHDVAQVVGAGFSISETAGETATLVKLMRVTLLAPLVLLLSLSLRSLATEPTGKKPPLVPGFVVGFVVLAGLNSLSLVPEALAALLVDLSRWALLFGIAAVGMKTSLRSIKDVGAAAIVLIVAETFFIALFVAGGLHLVG